MSRAAELARIAAEESDATDAGAAWHQANPDALLIQAWRHAGATYGERRRHQVEAFVTAFHNARRQRDAYHQEESA